jgi:hypothetical protein
MSREFFILIIDNPAGSLNTYFLLTDRSGVATLILIFAGRIP